MTFSNNMDQDQAPQNVGSDLWSIFFDNQNNLFAEKCLFYMEYDLNSEDIEICQFYKLSKNFWRALYIERILYMNLSQYPSKCKCQYSHSEQVVVQANHFPIKHIVRFCIITYCRYSMWYKQLTDQNWLVLRFFQFNSFLTFFCLVFTRGQGYQIWNLWPCIPFVFYWKIARIINE